MHQLYRKTTLPISLEQAWDFFSSPLNLKKITPPSMDFEITSRFEKGVMHPGMIICYKVTPFLGIRLNWMTEITHVEDHKFFVDEQKIGPYKIWHHQHHFRKSAEGVEMIDIVNYALPLGLVGRLMEPLLVKKRLQTIFNYREIQSKALFGK